MNNMPPVVKNLLIINALCFLASQINPAINELLGLHFMGATHFHFFQFVTYMFMHGGWSHIFFNMFALWMFGRIIEHHLGSQRFLIYYMACGIGAGFVQEIAQYVYFFSNGVTLEMLPDPVFNPWYTVGASGAVYGILMAFGMMFPDERLFIFPIPVPIKAKYFVFGYGLIELLSAVSRSADGVAHFAHLGGMLFGFALLQYWRNNRGGRSGGYHDPYDRGNQDSLWDRISKWFRELTEKKRPDIKVSKGGQYNQDMDYRRRKKEEEDELNEILDKVRRSGYTNLTDEEKRRLFDISKRK